MTLKNKQLGVAGVLAAVLSVIGIIGFVNGGIDEQIDDKIIKHEAEFELKQQETIGEIKQDIATLKERSAAVQDKLNDIDDQGRHTQELVEQLIREN